MEQMYVKNIEIALNVLSKHVNLLEVQPNTEEFAKHVISMAEIDYMKDPKNRLYTNDILNAEVFNEWLSMQNLSILHN